MRIISGRFRGRKLRVPPGTRVRPTGDRMKGSIFSSLGKRTVGANVLDLFAGSGALGLEALSRGAAGATFIEKDTKVCRFLRENINTLGIETECRVICADVPAYLKRLESADKFDLIFADPPFSSRLVQQVFSWWVSNCCSGSVLVVECPEKDIPNPEEYPVEVVKSGRFGDSSFSILISG